MSRKNPGIRRWSVVSRQIIFGVLSQIIVFTGLFVWIGGFSMGASIALAIGVLFLGRILSVLGSFVIAWWYGSPVPDSLRLGHGKLLRLVFWELASAMAVFFVFHPFEALLNQHDPQASLANDQVPILLVHGFYGNAGFWWSIKRWLRRQGITSVYTLNLDPPFSDIEGFAEQLAQRIEQICVHAKCGQIILVGHSLGGLVCRAYLRTHGENRVSRLITLGTPHHGTIFARFLSGNNVKQMRPGSEWLRHIGEYVANIPVVSAYSHHDNIVAPQTSACLECTEQVEWIGVGHLTLAFSRLVKTLLLQQVKAVTFNIDLAKGA